MSITIEAISPPESGPFSLELHLTTDIHVTPETARRKVSVYVGNYIADLLSGEAPSLVWRNERAFWRVPVILTSHSRGRIGQVGTIDVDVRSGELQINKEKIEEIETYAENLAISAAL
jgi:hypothetical protein